MLIVEGPSYGGRRSFEGYDTAYYDYTFPFAQFIGEPRRIIFLTMTSFGVKQEGSPFQGYYRTQELAEDALHQNIQRHFAMVIGYYHWREKPKSFRQSAYKIEFDRLVEIPLWVATARVAVDPYDPTKEKGAEAPNQQNRDSFFD